MGQWINARGATLDKIIDTARGRIWVIERMPPRVGKIIEVWEAWAEVGDRPLDVMAKWAASAGLPPLPRTAQARQRLFDDVLQSTSSPLMLVVHDAHLLKGHLLDKMRLFAEKADAVLLVGDISLIEVATRKYPGFFQRAAYCVDVTDVFA